MKVKSWNWRIRLFYWFIVRRWVFYRDGQHCFYCAEPLTLLTLTIDHYHPRSKAGNDLPGNLRLCCKPCNKRKRNHAPNRGLIKYLSVWRRYPLISERQFYLMRLLDIPFNSKTTKKQAGDAIAVKLGSKFGLPPAKK